MLCFLSDWDILLRCTHFTIRVYTIWGIFLLYFFIIKTNFGLNFSKLKSNGCLLDICIQVKTSLKSYKMFFLHIVILKINFLLLVTGVEKLAKIQTIFVFALFSFKYGICSPSVLFCLFFFLVLYTNIDEKNEWRPQTIMAVIR